MDYPNPTCPIYPNMPSPLQIGVYPNPTYAIYRILPYRRPSGGASYGLDNRLTAWELALEPKDKGAL